MTQAEVLDPVEVDTKDTSAVAVLLEKKSLFADPVAAAAAVSALEHEVGRLKEAGIDCSVAEVDKDARLRRRQLKSLCNRGDEHRKDTNAPHQRVIDANNKLWNELEPRIRALVPVFDGPIKAEEARKEAEAKAKAEAERARVAAHKERLAAIVGLPVRLIAASSETLAAEILTLEGLDITAETWEEFAGDAMVERDSALDSLRVLHTNKVAAEEAAARAEEERQARIKAEEETRLAREKAEKEAKEAADKQAAELADLRRQLAAAKAANTPAEQADDDATAAVKVEEPEGEQPTAQDAAQERAHTAIEAETTGAPAAAVEANPRPTDAEIIKAVADRFDVTTATAIEWLCALDLSEVA